MDNSNTLVIHHIAGSAARTLKIVDGLSDKAGSRVCLVAFNDTVGELADGGLECHSPADYATPQDFAKWDKEALALVKSLGIHSLDPAGQTIIQLLEYGPTSLWWFVEADFYRFYMGRVIRYIGSLGSIIDREKPARMVIMDDSSLLVKTAALVARSRGVPLQSILPEGQPWLRRLARRLIRQAFQWAAPRGREIRGFLRRRLWQPGAARPASQESQTHRRKIFLASMGREYVAAEPASGGKRLEDPTLGFLMRELETDAANEMVFLYKAPGKFKLRLPEEICHNRVSYKPWDCYETARVRRTVSAQAKLLHRKWRRLRETEQFTGLFTYRGINLWEICRPELERLFYVELPAMVKHVELAREIVEAERPDIMVIACENLPDNKAMVTTGNLRGIPVLAVQHGRIDAAGDFIVDYYSTPQELAGKPAKSLTFPWKLAIYGESVRQVLVNEIGYPFPERLVVTGQPGFDALVQAGKLYSREAFCTRWQIDPTRKLVLIASQTFHVAGNRDAFFRGILQALRDDGQLQMVIKPHPAGGVSEAWYNGLIQEIGGKAVVLPPKSDTYEALHACDVLIAFYSTIALEAMILGKPVVTVNLTGQPDPVDYASSGAALGVYRPGDIAQAVRDALDNPEVRKSLGEARDRYLPQQVRKLDGQATKRVVSLMYSMMDGKISS